MKNNAIKIIVAFGVISILLIFTIQIYWLKITYNQHEREFDKNVEIALKKVASDIADYLQIEPALQSPVIKLNPSYFIVSIDDTIDHSVLEFFLKNELENVNIKADFEYGSYNCFTGKMQYGNYITYADNKSADVIPSILPTHADLTYYFGINFPHKLMYISKSMTIWTFFSLISLLVLAFFGYSIFTILKQHHYTELQKDFINNMTHELKTPLSSIKLASDFFLENEKIKDDERLYKYSEIIHDQNNRLNQQVENVLQIVKTERKKFQLNVERINIIEIINQCINLYSSNIEDMGKIDFQSKLDALYINADKFHFSNVMYNLLDNSVKYCTQIPYIQVNINQINRQLILSVSDNGIGIDKDSIKKVFRKFYRVPTGNIHNVKGFGLGLYYVKQICKKHKWKINIESKINVGTTVKVMMKMK